MENKSAYFEYKMPEELAKELLRNRDGLDKKMRPNEYLCKVVNEQYGLLRPVTRVLTF